MQLGEGRSVQMNGRIIMKMKIMMKKDQEPYLVEGQSKEGCARGTVMSEQSDLVVTLHHHHPILEA